LLLPQNLRISDIDNGMVEFHKVLAIHDPDWSTKCFSSLGSTIVKRKMKFHRLKGNADMICTGVMRMTKFSMGLEILLSRVSYTPES
jgi:hypothetical protein